MKIRLQLNGLVPVSGVFGAGLEVSAMCGTVKALLKGGEAALRSISRA